MDRIRRTAVTLLLATLPATGLASDARVADVRVGQHGKYERIVVELEARGEVAVRWTGDESGAEIFEIAARPLLARQLLSTGRPRVGEMLLLAAENGAELRLEPQPRRTRAFLLTDPSRLVIDIAAPGEGAFDAPPDVRAILRERAPEPELAAVAEPEIAAVAPAESVPAPAEALAVAESPAPELLLPEAEEPAVEDPAIEPAPAPPAPAPRAASHWLRSRALLVPLLSGVAVLLLAAGGLALASAQRARPPRPSPELPDLGLTADRLDLLEKRLDEEVRARMELAEQLAQARTELGGMRDLFARLRAQAVARSAAPSAPQ
jgi:hypothetical protein